MIYGKLLQHVTINIILVEKQFGFRTSSSTDKASYKLIDEILNALINRMMIGGIFCDLQKAFDCVNHNILPTKLEFYGITDIAYKLIKPYLEGRYQRVVLNNNSHSNWCEIKHGVPQGSILGPLLFYSMLMTCQKSLMKIPDLFFLQMTQVSLSLAPTVQILKTVLIKSSMT
jgi:hypothetical protein